MTRKSYEAPDSFEPPFPDPEVWPLDEAEPQDADAVAILKYREAVTREVIDGSGEIGLFEDVIISEGNDGDSYVVPTRTLGTLKCGMWQLAVSGKVQWFKHISDFGDLRFTQKGEAGWIPHLFPFEEVDDKGLPVILDRERATVDILLSWVRPAMALTPDQLRLQTPHGVFLGRQSVETWYSWGGYKGRVQFDEFSAEGRDLPAQKVVFDESSRSLDYELGGQNQWRGEHFGSIWVPMDLLRKGINPLVVFPLFAEAT